MKVLDIHIIAVSQGNIKNKGNKIEKSPSKRRFCFLLLTWKSNHFPPDFNPISLGSRNIHFPGSFRFLLGHEYRYSVHTHKCVCVLCVVCYNVYVR